MRQTFLSARSPLSICLKNLAANKLMPYNKTEMPKMIKIVLWAIGIAAVFAALILGYVMGSLLRQPTSVKNSVQPTSTKIEISSISPTRASTTVSVLKTVYVNSPDGLNLRKEATLTSDVIVLMPYGTELKVSQETQDWYFGSYQSQSGYFKKEFTSTDSPFKGWQLYDNSTYKISLKLPSTWKDYATKESGAGTKENPARIEFALPLKEATESATVAAIFEIVIYTISDWQEVKDSTEPNKPSFLAQSSAKAFAYRTFSDAVTLRDLDYAQALKDVDQIVDTFEYRE